jgi:hypothetical protein
MRLPSFRNIAAAALILPLLGGCNAWQTRAEFAPPQSRWPDTLPSPAAADAPPPPIREVHCYRTLAVVDCFAAPQPERSGYMGRYPGT